MSHLMSLSGVKRTWAIALHTSAFDPKRTFASRPRPRWPMEYSRKKRNDVGITNLSVAIFGLVLHPKNQLCFPRLCNRFDTQHQLAARHWGSTALAARKDLSLLDTERELRWAFKDFNLGQANHD